MGQCSPTINTVDSSSLLLFLFILHVSLRLLWMVCIAMTRSYHPYTITFGLLILWVVFWDLLPLPTPLSLLMHSSSMHVPYTPKKLLDIHIILTLLTFFPFSFSFTTSFPSSDIHLYILLSASRPLLTSPFFLGCR